MRSNAQPLPPPPVPAPTSQWPSTSYSPPPAPMPLPPSSLPPPSAFNAPSPFPAFKQEEFPPASLNSTPTTIPSAGPSIQTPSFADLLSTLMKAGVVTQSNTPVGAGATVKDEATDIFDEAREAARAYRNSILSHSVQLTTSGITKYVLPAHWCYPYSWLISRTSPPISVLLYEQLGAQCKQCGLRFLDTVDGKKALEDHLDMHFRQNVKANQNIGRGHSRSWFVGVEVNISPYRPLTLH